MGLQPISNNSGGPSHQNAWKPLTYKHVYQKTFRAPFSFAFPLYVFSSSSHVAVKLRNRFGKWKHSHCPHFIFHLFWILNMFWLRLNQNINNIMIWLNLKIFYHHNSWSVLLHTVEQRSINIFGRAPSVTSWPSWHTPTLSLVVFGWKRLISLIWLW